MCCVHCAITQTLKQSARAAKKDFPFALELRKAQLQLERGEEEEEAGKADLRVLFVPHRLQRLDWDSRTLGGPAQAEQEREQQEEERRRAAIDKRRQEQKHGAGLVDEGVAMSAAVTQRMDEELRAPHDSAPPTRRTSLQRLRSASRKASARALAVAELSKAGKERSSAQAATDRAMALLKRGGSNRRLSQRASDPDADHDRSALLLNTADGPRVKRPSTGSVVEMMQADRDRRKTLPPVQQRGDARRAPRPASARVRRQYIAERDAARAARASLVPPPDKQRELELAPEPERRKLVARGTLYGWDVDERPTRVAAESRSRAIRALREAEAARARLAARRQSKEARAHKQALVKAAQARRRSELTVPEGSVAITQPTVLDRARGRVVVEAGDARPGSLRTRTLQFDNTRAREVATALNRAQDEAEAIAQAALEAEEAEARATAEASSGTAVAPPQRATAQRPASAASRTSSRASNARAALRRLATEPTIVGASSSEPMAQASDPPRMGGDFSDNLRYVHRGVPQPRAPTAVANRRAAVHCARLLFSSHTNTKAKPIQPPSVRRKLAAFRARAHSNQANGAGLVPDGSPAAGRRPQSAAPHRAADPDFDAWVAGGFLKGEPSKGIKRPQSAHQLRPRQPHGATTAKGRDRVGSTGGMNTAASQKLDKQQKQARRARGVPLTLDERLEQVAALSQQLDASLAVEAAVSRGRRGWGDSDDSDDGNEVGTDAMGGLERRSQASRRRGNAYHHR